MKYVIKIGRFLLRVAAAGMMGLIIGRTAFSFGVHYDLGLFVAGAFGGTLGPLVIEMAEALGREKPRND